MMKLLFIKNGPRGLGSMTDEERKNATLKMLSDKVFERLYPSQDNGFIRRINLANKGKTIHVPTMKEFVRGKRI